MPKLILIRHGQSVHNAGDTVQGSDPDPTNILSTVGKDQSFTFGHVLAQRRIAPACLWSSPLPRARQTGRIVAKAMKCRLPIQEDPRLREICKGSRGLPGGLEGRRRDEAKTPAYREQYQRLGWDFRHGSLESGGETAREAGRRFLTVLNMIADGLADNATGLVFAHGQVIRYGIGAAWGFPDLKKIDASFRLGNCESLIVVRSPQRIWRLVGRMASA